MSALRKLQSEIDKTYKKIDEGLVQFDGIWDKVRIYPSDGGACDRLHEAWPREIRLGCVCVCVCVCVLVGRSLTSPSSLFSNGLHLKRTPYIYVRQSLRVLLTYTFPCVWGASLFPALPPRLWPKPICVAFVRVSSVICSQSDVYVQYTHFKCMIPSINSLYVCISPPTSSPFLPPVDHHG